MKLAVLALMVATTSAQLGFFKIDKAFRDQIDPSSVDALGVVNTAGKAIKTKIAEVKQPVDQTVAYIGSSQCSNVKKLIGVDYEQIQGVAEPDLDQLTLNFISEDIQASFKLGSVASSLPRTPGYDPRKPLVIFMHGFMDDPSLFNFGSINEAFQSRGHYNILGLDASPLIRFLYLRSSTYVRLIGERLGETLAAMVQAGLDPKDIHLVGHSLGSHISGFAGKNFESLTGKQVGRITGLDPAGPCFSHVDEDLRLKATDAEFVDVIHTDGGVYGLKDPVGDVDFFPNGGEQQPNCLFQFCSHNRVVALFAESVRNPEAFPARRCDTWDEFKREQCSEDISLMGYGCRPGTEGRYYLSTGDKSPFGLGEPGTLFQDGGDSKIDIMQPIADILI